MTNAYNYPSNYLFPEIHIRAAEKLGPHLWVSSQIHGNEPAGTQAIHRVLDEIDSGKLKLNKGEIHFAPFLNKFAAPDKRFVDSNLNRRVVLDAGANIITPEDVLRQQIVKAVTGFCQRPALIVEAIPSAIGPQSARVHIKPPDYGRFALDLHTFHQPGEPHAWIYTPRHGTKAGQQSTRLALATGVNDILCGWVDAYKRVADPKEIAATAINPEPSRKGWEGFVRELGFADYAHELAVRKRLAKEASTLGQLAFDHGVPSITLEGGQHKDPSSADVHYRAIRSVLGLTGITEPYDQTPYGKRDVNLYTVRNLHYRVEGDRLASQFRDLEKVVAGQPLIEGGRQIVAPKPPKGETGHVLFPYPDAAVGVELVYWATKKKQQLTL